MELAQAYRTADYAGRDEARAALQSHVDAIEADAARYRWLRKARLWTSGTLYIGVDSAVYRNKWALDGDEADVAIDTARKNMEADNG